MRRIKHHILSLRKQSVQSEAKRSKAKCNCYIQNVDPMENEKID